MTEEDRKKSIERAKQTGMVIAATGLSAILPGSGPVAHRLATHFMDALTANRIARLDEFHRRVFEGEVSEEQINDRFQAMSDADFQHLLAAMLSDIAAEKVPIYSAVYIHVIEKSSEHLEKKDRMDGVEKRMWVLAASTLHVYDFDTLKEITSAKPGHHTPHVEPDTLQRLLLVGAVTAEPKLFQEHSIADPTFMTGDAELRSEYEATPLGKELVSVLAEAIKEAWQNAP